MLILPIQIHLSYTHTYICNAALIYTENREDHSSLQPVYKPHTTAPSAILLLSQYMDHNLCF